MLTLNDPGGFSDFPQVGSETVTLDPDNAGTTVTLGPHKGAHVLYAYFTGGGRRIAPGY